jgi:hypothetical protein
MEPPAATDNSLRARVAALHARHAGKTLVLFFLGGFLFDAVMLSRIDEPGMLIQQGAYLLLCGTLLAVTQRMELKQLEPPRVLRKAWHYVDHVIHFMLGTLLNAYSIFYFRSASGLTALGFVVVIVALLALNELPRFQKLGPVVLYALYSICLTSYLAYLLPVLLGYIRPWMFYLAVGAALLPLTLHVLLLLRWGRAFGHVARHAAIPAYGVQLAFLLVYAHRAAGAAGREGDGHLSRRPARAGRAALAAAEARLEVLAEGRPGLSRARRRQGLVLRAHLRAGALSRSTRHRLVSR